MNYSDAIATLSFVISLAAFCLPYWRDRKIKAKERRKELLNLFTKTDWYNEGDVFTKPKAYYTLNVEKTDGISDVYGTFTTTSYSNNVQQSYEFNGTIDAKGILATTLRIPIGKTGANIAKVKFTYSDEKDQITYRFDGFVDNKDMAHEHSHLDAEQKLWRTPLPM